MTEEILRHLEWRGLDCDAFCYRTSAGAEIDLILDGNVGFVPIEIKYTHSIDRRRFAVLREFVAERRCRADPSPVSVSVFMEELGNKSLCGVS